MYHMIGITAPDQHVHRFLWRSFETDRQPDTYAKTVLTFGDHPSPTMAITAMRKTADMNQVDKPKAAESISKNSYVDDIFDSVCSTDEAKTLTTDIDEVLKSGGFHVKKWITNGEINTENSDEIVLGTKDETEKVLGTVWRTPEEDEFSFKIKDQLTKELPAVKHADTSQSVKLTKRRILSQLAGIFDPIGVAAAVIVKSKIAMQELWQLGIGWDDDIPPDQQRKWLKLFQEMAALNQVKSPRCLTPPGAIGNPILAIFCDASRLAFGACAYVRWKLFEGNFGIRFVAARSRVAPLKELTIPRLELQAAVVASRLGKTISESRLLFEAVIYFSDSRVVLAWIKGQPRSYKPFVSSRISEIQSNSQPDEWFRCPTHLNVADDVTKGISSEEISGRWLNGPEFLKLPIDHWPMEQDVPDMNEVNKERRKIRITCATTVAEPVINCEDFSKWKRLLRVTAYVMRSCRNTRIKSSHESNEEMIFGPLTAEEIKGAEIYWLKCAQPGLVKKMKDGEFKSLTPFVDSEGIIRVGGRADPSLVSYNKIHPALLPCKHWISVLVTRDAHQSGHSGVATTTAKVRRQYWVIKGHNNARKVKNQCTFCKEMQKTQLMAKLPPSECNRIPLRSCTRPATILVKFSRNKTVKHYGVIFTCLNTRAVFFSYRGYPKFILSDNGLQMVGAERELRLVIEGWDKDKLREFCAKRGITCQFTTPLAPHHNDCAESMVKSIKTALKCAIGDTKLTPFELYTCLLEAANLVNQRPIGRVARDPDDGAYLCPNDILMGRATNDVPQGPFRQTKNPQHRFEFCQRIVDAFWKRWSRDVFPHLVPRKTWTTETRNVRVDDFVIVADPNAVRGKWNICKVQEVFPGDDSKVRNVKVKTASGVYTRPITKICVIYPAEGFEEE